MLRATRMPAPTPVSRSRRSSRCCGLASHSCSPNWFRASASSVGWSSTSACTDTRSSAGPFHISAMSGESSVVCSGRVFVRSSGIAGPPGAPATRRAGHSSTRSKKGHGSARTNDLSAERGASGSSLSAAAVSSVSSGVCRIGVRLCWRSTLGPSTRPSGRR